MNATPKKIYIIYTKYKKIKLLRNRIKKIFLFHLKNKNFKEKKIF